MIDHPVAVTFDHDQALVLSDWLYERIGTERFDALVDEDPAVWAPLRLLAGALETTLPDIFAPDYQDRLDRARRRLIASSAPTPARRQRPSTDHRAGDPASQRPGELSQVSGWIYEDAVVSLLRNVAAYIDYGYDWLDEQALVGALDTTNDADDNAWFDYPLHGSPVLTVWLARSVGTAVVMVRVEGPMDDVLAARIHTVIDMLSSPRE